MMDKKNYLKEKSENGRIAGGIILVAVGAVLLLRNTGFIMPTWLFSWPMILILVGIYSGFKHKFTNSSWIIITGVGVFFLVSRFIPSLGLEPLFWPLIIIGLGVLFILKPKRKKFLNFKQTSDKDEWKNSSTVFSDNTANDAGNISSDYISVESVFSGVKKNIVSKNFKGGKISSVFGGAEINLSQCEINGPVQIKFDVVFGGAKLIVPAHWSVQNEIDGVFHGVDDNRSFNPSEALNPDKVLILKGSAVFGGIEIRSY